MTGPEMVLAAFNERNRPLKNSVRRQVEKIRKNSAYDRRQTHKQIKHILKGIK